MASIIFLFNQTVTQNVGKVKRFNHSHFVCVCLQENLLQSVLPVYISMKMKLAIMERLQDCKDKEEQQRLVKDNNFHSLYVKRHENVR